MSYIQMFMIYNSNWTISIESISATAVADAASAVVGVNGDISLVFYISNPFKGGLYIIF